MLATGGFESSEEMREQYQPAVGKGWSSGSPDNTGDGIRAGEAVGGALELMDDAWWMPAMRDSRAASGRWWPSAPIRSSSSSTPPAGASPTRRAPTRTSSTISSPGTPAAISHIPAFMIIDHHGWTHNIIAGPPAGEADAQGVAGVGPGHARRHIAELARRLGVPPTALSETAERFNRFARQGRDEDFHRGESAYDQLLRQSGLPQPQPRRGRTAAVLRVSGSCPGDLGTKGGLLTDENARVLREDGTPSPACTRPATRRLR